MKVRHFLVTDWSGERARFHGFLLEHQSPMVGDWKPAPQHGYYQESSAGGEALWRALSYFAKWYTPDIHSIGVNEWDAITADYNFIATSYSLAEFLAPVIYEELYATVKEEIEGFRTKELVEIEALRALRDGTFTLPLDAPIGFREWLRENRGMIWKEATTEWIEVGADAPNVHLAYRLARESFDAELEDFDLLDFHLPAVVNWDVGGDDEQLWSEYIRKQDQDIMVFEENADLRHDVMMKLPAITVSAGLDYNKALELFREQR